MSPDPTPGQLAGEVFDRLTDFAGTVSDEDLEGRVGALLDRLFEDGYPDVVAEMWRRSGMPEERVFEAVMAAAERLDRDPDLVGELVFGDS